MLFCPWVFILEAEDYWCIADHCPLQWLWLIWSYIPLCKLSWEAKVSKIELTVASLRAELMSFQAVKMEPFMSGTRIQDNRYTYLKKIKKYFSEKKLCTSFQHVAGFFYFNIRYFSLPILGPSIYFSFGRYGCQIRSRSELCSFLPNWSHHCFFWHVYWSRFFN